MRLGSRHDHVRFDTGSLYIDDSYKVWEHGSTSPLCNLRLRPGHTPDKTFISYHRKFFGN